MGSVRGVGGGAVGVPGRGPSTPAIGVTLALIAVSLVSAGCGGSDVPGGDPEQPETASPEIAFFSTDGSAGYDIGITDAGGGRGRVLSGESAPGPVGPQLFTRISWSPDGRRLYFAGSRDRRDSGSEGVAEIHAVDADGGRAARLTSVGDARDPVVSPDGQTIVFTRMINADGSSPLPRGELWRLDLDGGDPERLTRPAHLEIDRPGSFSRDGSTIAFTRTEIDRRSLDSSSSVWTIGIDGSDEGELLERASDPAYSPDGERIAFASDRDETGELCYGDRCFYAGELYVADADGNDPERLTHTAELNEAMPSWSTDGARIAYQRGMVYENAEAMSVLQVNPDGSCPRPLLRGSGEGPWYASPAWRPSEPRAGGGRLRC